MNFEQIKKYLPWGAVGIPVVLAIVVFIFGLVNAHALSKTLLIIASVLLLVLAAVFFMIFFVLGERKTNFFLTDVQTGRNIPLDRLSFVTVNEKMNIYVSERIEDELDMQSCEILTRRGIFGQRDVYRPLVAYKILFDLAQENSNGSWQCFCSAKESAFKALVAALSAANDDKLAQKLIQLRARGDAPALIDFIVNNKRYIQNKMMLFVKTNVSMFDDNYA
jgi:hypothetical protein